MKTLTDIGISFDEWEANRKVRAFEDVLTATQPLTGWRKPDNVSCDIPSGTQFTARAAAYAANGESDLVRVRTTDGFEYDVKRRKLEQHAAPDWLAVSQIRSGNSHLLERLYGSATSSDSKSKFRKPMNGDPQPDQVRILFRAISVVLMNGDKLIIECGTTVDICESIHVSGKAEFWPDSTVTCADRRQICSCFALRTIELPQYGASNLMNSRSWKPKATTHRLIDWSVKILLRRISKSVAFTLSIRKSTAWVNEDTFSRSSKARKSCSQGNATTVST